MISIRLGGAASIPAAKTLQLGVGKSVIFDLPEEAGEILRRRSQDRQRDRALRQASLHLRRRQWPNQHFRIGARRPENSDHRSLRRPRRRRIVGPLQRCDFQATTSNVRTVADKIILTGSVASAEEAQKALDIASGFVDDASGPAPGGAGGVSRYPSRPSNRRTQPNRLRRKRRQRLPRKSDQFSHHPRDRPGQSARHDRGDLSRRSSSSWAST